MVKLLLKILLKIASFVLTDIVFAGLVINDKINEHKLPP